jgi:uncharacterized protein (TIGR00369 family)
MPAETRARAAAALDVPLLGFLGASLLDEEDPAEGIALVTGEHNVNAVDFLHGGAISTILDVAAYLSLLPELNEEEEAITHALFVSYLAAVKGETRLVACGRVLRRSKRLAFVTSELRDQDRLVATAQVTKSVVSGRQ